MAIGMTAALLGSAVLGAGASALGASSNSKAINSATSAQERATQQNLALQRDVYDTNRGIVSPFVQRGNAAGENINALLGIPGASTTTTGAPAGAIDWGAYVAGNPDAAANWNVVRNTSDGAQFGGDVSAFGQYHYGADGSRRDLAPYTAQTVAPTTAATAGSAFDNYLNSTGYQFQLGEANKGANAQFRASGALDSGAAVKSAQDRAQNMSTGFFNNYLGLLSNQQSVGLAGASALAGVGTNFANNSSNINQNQASATGAAAAAKANNTNSLLGNLSSSFGIGAGALSGFGGGGGTQWNMGSPNYEIQF